MEGEVILFEKPEELIRWVDENDLLMGLEEKDAEILLNYMEGHGYSIGSRDGKLVRADICEENGELEDYSIDDVIDAVCEWNYELVLEASNERDNPSDFINFCRSQTRYDSYKKDEKRLDKMFDKTCYGKEVEELATRLANEAIKRMEESKKLEAVSENVLAYQTDKKEKVR